MGVSTGAGGGPGGGIGGLACGRFFGREFAELRARDVVPRPARYGEISGGCGGDGQMLPIARRSVAREGGNGGDRVRWWHDYGARGQDGDIRRSSVSWPVPQCGQWRGRAGSGGSA